MKNKRAIIVLITMALMFRTAKGAESKLTFSLVVSEGFGSIAVGDLNTTLTSFNAAYDKIRLYNPPWACVGEIKPIPNSFTDWEMELQWNIWWGFSLGIAVSAPTRYSGSSYLTYSIMQDALNQTIINTFQSSINVSPPLKLSLHKSVNAFRNIRASINGGIGIFRARMTQTHLMQARYPLEDAALTKFYFDVRGRRLGYHLGAALEYRVSQSFSALAEGEWRFATIRTFKGIEIGETREYDSDGNLRATFTNSTEGPLYHYFGQDFYNGEWREKLLVTDLVPPWYGYDMPLDIRRAFLDLGGFTLRIGLRVRLF